MGRYQKVLGRKVLNESAESVSQLPNITATEWVSQKETQLTPVPGDKLVFPHNCTIVQTGLQTV